MRSSHKTQSIRPSRSTRLRVAPVDGCRGWKGQVNDRIKELGEKLGGSRPELDFACECEDDTCVEKIRMSLQRFLAIESLGNQFIVLRGHQVPEVEDVTAERDRFLIVSKRGAGAELVAEHS